MAKLMWSGSPGESHPRAPTDPCVTVSRYTALAVLVIWRPVSPRPSVRSTAAVWLPRSASFLVAFFQVLCFLYFLMIQRSR